MNADGPTGSEPQKVSVEDVDESRTLITQKRFGPFFFTQALGAFNDNVFKQSLLILFTYQGLVLLGLRSEQLVNFAAMIFILPFFLLSSLAGQVAEKYEKSMLIRRIKMLEVAIMVLAGIAFASGSPAALLGVLFLMGTQSTFFGPIKFAILPQILSTAELVKGNGQIAMATFVAILLGSLLGGMLIVTDGLGWPAVTGITVMIAMFGYWVSRSIPAVAATDPNLKIDFNGFSQTWALIRYSRQNIVVFRSILGISWFWFFGAIILAQLPPLVEGQLMGSPGVANTVFAAFSIGIGAGSMLCDKLSDRRVEIGLVPLGSIGLTVFGVDLYFAAEGIASVAQPSAIGEFLGRDGAWRFLFDIVALGVFAGLFIVPLNALIQHRSAPENRSRIIAGANVINAFAMVIASIFAILLLRAGLSVTELILTVSIINAAVAIYIYLLVPEFLLRFAAWILVRTIYRVRARDLNNIPADGPALLICNHVSFADALVVGGMVARPVRFVMYYKIHRWPILGHFFKAAQTIPIAGRSEDPEILESAYDKIAAELAAGEVVCIFPEGRLSPDGELLDFKRGVERIIERTPVPVVPMALGGLWGSLFSKSDGGVLKGPPRRFLSRISLRTGKPISPDEASAERLRNEVRELLGQADAAV